jgi:hypothetical protein
MKSRNRVMYVIIALIAIGLLSQIIKNPYAYMIPLAVFGIVFYFYKFPPNRRRGGSTSTARKADYNKKKARFKVIQGSKTDHKTDEDDPPPYH